MAVTRKSEVEILDFTTEINKIPRQPTLFDQILNIGDEAISTTTVQVDVVQRNLAQMVASRRGGERTNIAAASYITKSFVPAFFTLDGVIRPTDVQNLRQAGTANDLETVDNVRMKIMEDLRRYHGALRQKAIAEAIKGASYVGNDLYTAYDYYTEFGVTKKTITWDWTSATLDPIAKAEEAWQYVIDNAQDAAGSYELVCLCGKNFFSQLLQNPVFREAYQFYMNGAEPLRTRSGGGSIVRQFSYGNVTYYDMSSQKIGGTPLIADGAAYFLPVGIPDMFTIYHAPGDLIDSANQPGQELYMVEKRDYRSVKIESETSLICVNKRPELCVVVSATYA